MAAAQERFSPAGLLLFAARGQKGPQMTKFKMNRTQFMLLTALNMLGSGILMLPAKVAQVGGIGLLSWFVVCLAAVAMAYAFANCGIYSKYRLGGLGAIAENAFGMPGSFLTNYIYAFSVVIANVAIATTAVGYLLGIFGIHADLGVVQCLTIALLWLSTLVNFAGVKAMGRLSAVTIWGILIPFKRVGRTDVPYMGLFILCIIQTLLVPFMPVSNLFSQFDLLVDISVITNVFPYFLCMAATFVVVRRAGLQGVKKVCVEAAALGSLIFIGWYFSLMDGDVMKFATIVFFLGIAFYGLFVAKDGSTELPDQ